MSDASPTYIEGHRLGELRPLAFSTWPDFKVSVWGFWMVPVGIGKGETTR